ncbi:imm11 family protein [Corallococcus macrosporus]|uniref:Immunity MXAN-0049 protein domain-containing protein n=1 Tax=Myxococcus fulvus (strain ATCC BAA-855 / HW-1) TaxID=483219 RepID=F8CMF6_MYXFH|nr:DUF1629 domain-containing protein [Corallococcus macrosporus]AEI64023.1 hypothetical protein LILAB_10560 [Corallococcus macrosporus]
MNFYYIHLMPRDNLSYCFIDDYPSEVGIKSYKIGKGLMLGADYPAASRVYMTERYTGIQLSDLIENACGMLIVSKRIKETFEQVNNGPTEYLPLTICNHKKRVASTDYFIINPLGTIDCLNLKASTITYHDEKIVQVQRPVLAPEKLKNVPHLFRIQEHTYSFLMSELMLERLGTLTPPPTNFYFEQLDQAPAQPGNTRSAS